MTALFNSIFEISLVSSVIIGFLLIVSPLLEKKYSSKSLCIVWLFLALRLLIPFNAHLQQSVITIPVPVHSITRGTFENDARTETTVQTTQGVPQQALNMPASDTGTNHHSLPPEDIVTLIWAAGAATCALVQVTRYFMLRHSVRRFSRPVKDKILLESFDQILAEFDIKAGHIAVLEYTKAGSPMMMGFFRPAILMPKTDYEASELELIIRHELVHYKRKDLWFKLLLTFANALHWFNPLVWLMIREANMQIENCCDREIIGNKDVQTRKKYSETILAAMEQYRSNYTGLSTHYHGGKKIMKQRFSNIFDFKAKKRGTPVVFAALIAILLSGVLGAGQAEIKPVDSSGSTSSDVTQTALPSPTAPDTSSDALSIAKSWAEAVKNRDGKAQYALMTKALQEKENSELASLNWVTGVSSPWIASYTFKEQDGGVRITYNYESSAGPENSYNQDIAFKQEDGALKIDSLSILQPLESTPIPPQSKDLTFNDLVSLMGLTKDELLNKIPEKSVSVDEGGLGFDKTGIRVWFDKKTHTKIAQVLIMTNKIDIDGMKLGDSYNDFKTKFGTPISDNNGDARFKYGDVYLSVVRDTSSDKVIAVYVLAENF